MEPEDDHGGQSQNLHDLQNYLSTFKKEIEPGDDILSHMDVDTGDVNDLYNSAAGASLQELGEGGVASQFSSGFYSEQGILDTPLSDDTTHQIHSIDASGEPKDKGRSLDLDSDQAQMTSFGDSPLTQGSLIMTSLGDSLDPSGGKVIRIVSLDEDGQYLSLGDASQMQILNQDLDMTNDVTDGVLALQGSDGALVTGGSTLPASILNCTTGALVVTGSGDAVTTMARASGGTKSSSGAGEMVALQTSGDNSQSQIVALPQGAEALTTMSSLLNADGTLNPDLGFQTITIMPHELCQGGDMNYVLIMAQQDGSKEATQQLAQIIDLKQENHEFSEDLVEINGEVKRVLRVVPKKYLNANFGMQLVCDYCDYTSPKRYLLTRHMKSHSDERPHKCKECDRGFKTPASLMNHVNTHTGIRPHKCKNCDAAFTTSGELVRHIRYRHTFEKPHRCPSCDYASVELSKLKRHMRSHTGERPYKCPHCPYASPDTYKLKRHLRIHTGEKPYECDVCHTRFTQSNSLKAHKLIHSGNKPVFQCKLCPTTCGRKTDLKIHFNKLHSEGSILECKKCGQMFSDRYSYKQHVRSHDFEKCFKCDECDFIANTDRSFDAHAAIHSNGKKFECDTCHVTFNLQQSLDKHKQNCPAREDLDSSKDKESAEKVYTVSQQNKMDILLGNESSPSSSTSTGGPLASGTLHRNLLQDIKDGKLGHVPQVVIVHPDGTLEEISSKLPIGDKMNLDDLFSALANNEKQQELDSGAAMVDNSEDRDSDAESSDHTGHGSPVRTDRGEKDVTSADNDDETAGESLQCEASTQAELESDTEADFVDDGHRMGSLEPKDNKTSLDDQFLNNSHSPSPLDHSEISTMSDSMSDAMTAHISSDTMSVHVSNATSSETLSSFIQAMAPTSASSSSPPLATLLTTVSEHSANSGSQQYVVVKGYTCLSSETGQPTLVNVAVDKDSLMKMLASLGGMSEGAGVQLLAGDLDSLSLDGKSNVISMTQEQLNDFAGLASISATTEGSAMEQTDSSSLEDTTNSDTALDTSKGSTLLNRQFKFSTLSIDALSMGKSPHNVDSSLPKELLSPSITSHPKGSPPLPSTSFTPHADAFKASMPVDQSESPLDSTDSQRPAMSPAEQFSGSSGAIDVGMEMFPEVTGMKTELSEPASLTHESNCDSICPGHEVMPTEPDVQASSQAEEKQESCNVEQMHPPEKHKRYARKRSSGSADPSLVMTGKRVRKALVKVSM